MKTILIDDEPMALEVLANMLSPYEDIDIIGRYTNPTQALEKIKVSQVDIIFLDIEMGDVNGLELAQVFMEKDPQVEIVFVTAYSQYAVDAFELNALDYLLKPIQEKRLFKAIERLRENIKEEQIEDKSKNTRDNRLKVLSFGGFQVLNHMGDPVKWRTQKSKEVFAYLWERKNAVGKDLIMEELFPDRDIDKASTLLHTTIYQLRKSLRVLGYANGIIYFDDSYQLNLPITSDLEKFIRIISSKAYTEENIRSLLEIYRGDFLEEGYHWAMELQEIFREAILNWIEEFAKRQIEQGKLSLILKVALDKAYEIDPFNCKFAEMIIHYYGMQKKKSNMRDFFHSYVKNLREEMNLEPRGSTINIYNKYMKA